MIKVIKLITGEDVVADIEIIENSSGKLVVMKRPQRFMVTSDGVGSIPLVPFSNDESYTINFNHVMLIAEPDADIKNGYNSQYGSGIVLPGKDIIH